MKNGRKLLCALLTVLLLFSALPVPAASAADAVPDAVLEAQNSVVQVYTFFYDANGDLYGYMGGSGFLAGLPGMSSKYVVTNDAAVSITWVPDGGSYQIAVFADGVEYPVNRVLSHRNKPNDVAVLELEEEVAGRTGLGFSYADALHYGDTVYLLAYPSPVDPMHPDLDAYVRGQSIDPCQVMQKDVATDNCRFFKLDMSFPPNMMGGLVVNRDGGIVGLATDRTNYANEGGYCLYSEDVGEIVHEMGMLLAWKVEHNGVTVMGESYANFSDTGEALYAIRADGRVSLAALQDYPEMARVEEVLTWRNIETIAGNYYTAAGLRKDGTVIRTGSFDDDSLRQETESWRNVVQIVTAYDHVIALRSDGTVLSSGHDWMNDGPGTDSCITDGHYDFSKWLNIKKLVSGGCAAGWTVLGLCSDGTVVDTTQSYLGEQPEEYDWSGEARNVVDVVSSGWLHVALKSDGTVICKGIDSWMRRDALSQWRDIIQVVIVGESTVVGLRRDGTVISTNEEQQLDASAGWYDINVLYGSEEYLIGLRADGTAAALCTMYYEYGESDAQASANTRQIESWEDLQRMYVQGQTVIGWQADGTPLSINFDYRDLA